MKKHKLYQLNPSCIYFRRIQAGQLVIEICNLRFQKWLKIDGLSAQIIDGLWQPKTILQMRQEIEIQSTGMNSQLNHQLERLLSRLKKKKIIESL